jgi:hypothetical protein
MTIVYPEIALKKFVATQLKSVQDKIWVLQRYAVALSVESVNTKILMAIH